MQALFAVNERWFINERGSEEAVDSMTVKPEGFSEVASWLLGCPGQDSVALARSVSDYEGLLAQVPELCARERVYREHPGLRRIRLREGHY